MNTLFNPCVLLADQSRFSHLGDRFRGDSSFDSGDLLFVSLLLIGISLLVWILARVAHLLDRCRFYGPLRLFLTLCYAHHLSWASRWMLWRFARSQRLAHPALVFVQPERFSATGRRLNAKQRAKLDVLREKLFGEEEDERRESRV